MRKLRASAAFFTTPGEFSISVLSCWSDGCAEVEFREGDLSDDFPLLVDGAAGIASDMTYLFLMVYQPLRESLEFFTMVDVRSKSCATRLALLVVRLLWYI